MFWASYIQAPKSLAIHFLKRQRDEREERWIQADSPRHGVDSAHRSAADPAEYPRDPGFPAYWMAFSFSRDVYTRPVSYGLRRDPAAVMRFRPGDRIAFAQSRSEGGAGNPAWDFAWFVPESEVNRAYQFEMRLA